MDLLLKDLCARLPYGVKCYIPELNDYRVLGSIQYDGINTLFDFWNKEQTKYELQLYISEFKPCLFPISSITEEQKEEYYSLADDVTIKPEQGSYFGIKIHCIKLGISDNPHEGVWDWIDLDAIDWLNKNHFDYRGLIEKSLALDATGLNVY